MTTVANVKGYINGDDWGIYRQLLSYSQLAELTPADAVDEELNADPIRYYNALYGDSHIDTIDGNYYIVDDLGEKTIWAQSGGWALSDGNYAFYFNGSGWEPEEQAPILKTLTELKAYTDSTALLTELNTYPSDYFTMLKSENHINDFCGGTDTSGFIDDAGGGTKIANKYYYYDGGHWVDYNKIPCPV